MFAFMNDPALTMEFGVIVELAPIKGVFLYHNTATNNNPGPCEHIVANKSVMLHN